MRQHECKIEVRVDIYCASSLHLVTFKKKPLHILVREACSVPTVNHTVRTMFIMFVQIIILIVDIK